MNLTGDKLKDSCLKYFENFSKKNIEALKKDFTDNIYLRDWEIEENGLDNVIKIIERIFSNTSSINIKPLNLIRENNQVSAEIEILINENELIKVGNQILGRQR